MDKGFTLSTSLPWELGKSLIKQESAAKAQERCQVGRGEQRACWQLEALMWPGLQGRALRAWSVFPTSMLAALRPHSPAPSMPGGGSQGELAGTGSSAPHPRPPVERPAPQPQHKAVPGPGCPDNRVGLSEA